MRIRHYLLACIAYISIISADLPSLEAQSSVASSGTSDSVLVWIYFRDKGPESITREYKATNLVSDRSLARRAKVRPADQLVDSTDYPVYGPYAESVSQRSCISETFRAGSMR